MAPPTMASTVSERAHHVLGSSWTGRGDGRASRERRQARLRRTALVVLTSLLMGTAVARWAQDPSVALPRTAGQRGAGPAVAEPAPPGPEAAQAPAADAAAAAGSAPGAQPGEVEEGAPEPTTVPAGASAEAEEAGQGTVHAVAIPAGKPAAVGRPVRYSIEIEDGAATGATQFAAVVQATLADARGWQSAEGVRFVPVSPEELAGGTAVDIRVTLATPALTARLCAPLNTTVSQVSCWNRGRAVLNLQRWVRGSSTYGDNLTGYRTYLVNHEVGHGLGHQHQHCPGPGKPAPIMVQQTKSLEGCTAWSWPTPP